MYSFIHGLNAVRTHVLPRVICDFLYNGKVLFRRVKMIYSDLIHSYVHYWRMRAMSVMIWNVWMIYRWCTTLGAAATTVTYEPAAVLFLHFLCWLEDGR